jgi:methylthioxylose transferase
MSRVVIASRREPARPTTRRRLVRHRGVVVWSIAIGLIAVSLLWGSRYQAQTPEIFLGAAPFVGRNFRDGWDWRIGWGLVGAAFVAVAAATAVITGWWWRVTVPRVVVASSFGAGLFATMLALLDGPDGVLFGATQSTEYLVNVPTAPPAGTFVRGFVAHIDVYSVHVRGHPPGFLLVLEAMDAVGLGGAWATAGLSILATCALPAGVLVAVWATAGAEWVRRAAPLLVVAPYALWMVTSADAAYTAVAAWGVALLALALRGRGSVVWGSASGLLLGALLFLTYGGATFLTLPATLVVAASRRCGDGRRRAWLAATAAIGGISAVVVGFAVAGFWWPAGAAATKAQYWTGTAQHRTWTYFAVANLAITAIAVGPATWAGVTRLADRRVIALVGGAAAALLAAQLSQYSRGEVERIWLLFFPWLALAGAGVIVTAARRRAACWVGAQATVAIVLQAALVSKW